jgi:hypothetical protein
MVTVWHIAWTHKGERYLLDVDTSGVAAVVGILLSETGRTDVKVIEREFEIDPDTQERIRTRVFARTHEIQEVPQ